MVSISGIPVHQNWPFGRCNTGTCPVGARGSEEMDTARVGANQPHAGIKLPSPRGIPVWHNKDGGGAGRSLLLALLVVADDAVNQAPGSVTPHCFIAPAVIKAGVNPGEVPWSLGVVGVRANIHGEGSHQRVQHLELRSIEHPVCSGEPTRLPSGGTDFSQLAGSTSSIFGQGVRIAERRGAGLPGQSISLGFALGGPVVTSIPRIGVLVLGTVGADVAFLAAQVTGQRGMGVGGARRTTRR